MLFFPQAIIASNLTNEYGSTLRKAHEFIKQSQMLENLSGEFKNMYRYICKGAWPLSEKDQGWQVSDCTAEAMKVLLLQSQMPPEIAGDRIEAQRLYDAVDFLLTLQSKKGGFSIWEPATSHPWLELLNPTEAFAGVVVKIEYGNWGICYKFAACFVLADLATAGKTYSNRKTVRKACDFLLPKQLKSGGCGRELSVLSKFDYG